jgi:hypothetical protein
LLFKFIRLVVGFLSGYLFIKWFPIIKPFSFLQIFIEFMMEPVNFLTSMLTFVVGFIVYASVLKTLYNQMTFILLSKKIKVLDVVIIFCSIISFVVLFLLGKWQTVIFFSFSVIYGMISRNPSHVENQQHK